MRLKATFITLLLLCLTLPTCCETVGGVKKLLDGPSVLVTGIVTSVRPGECYIESADRASGIWVIGNTAAIYPGDEVTAAGSMSTINGERVVYWSSIDPTGYQGLITPLAMPLKSIGGSWFGYQDCASDGKLFRYLPPYQCQEIEELRWTPATGLNNTGLLVTTWGKVISTDYSFANGLHWFHIDDGSGIISDLGDKGVIVYSNADVKYGQYVSITGISSVDNRVDDPTHLVRAIRPRNAADVQVQSEPVSEYPFSDDFDSDKPDRHWGLVQSLFYEANHSPASTIGTLSVDSGEIKIDIPTSSLETSIYSKHLVQAAEGDWDMEVKLRIQPTLGRSVYQGLGVALKDTPNELVPPIIDAYQYHEINWLAAITPYTNANPDQINGRMQYVVADTQVGYPSTTLNTLSKTAWFKVRKRCGIIYGSASTDGANYTGECSTKCLNRCYVAICGYSYGEKAAPGPFTGYCDYIRFTRVSE